MAELKPFDRVAEIYDETRGMPADVEARVADGMAAVLRELGPAPRLIEVGIGTGRVAAPLAARGVRVTGADIAPKMLAKAREKRRDIDALLAEAARLPFADGEFDAALFVHVLHLVPDVEATVREALRVVRAGGMLLHGSDDPQRDSVRDRAEIIIRTATARVIGEEVPLWRPYMDGGQTFERAATEAGATLERRMLASWTGTTSARKMLGRLARRDFASSWLISDAALPDVLREVEPELDALFGGMDAEHPYPRSFSAVVARLPAGA
jgi:SAM-dependent methyltransferase